jgi:hypothetical protein
MAATNHVARPRCGAPRSAVDPPILCPCRLRESGRGQPRPRRRAPRLIAALLTVGGIDAAAYAGLAAARNREAIVSKVDDAAAHVDLGRALAHQGKLAEAIAELRKARGNAQRGSKVARLIQRELTATDHQDNRREPPGFRALRLTYRARTPRWPVRTELDHAPILSRA